MNTLPSPSRRMVLRGAISGAVAGTAFGFPMINSGSFAAAPGSAKRYSKRTLDILAKTLVIDMLAVPKLDFTPDVFSRPLTAQQVADFRACGITGFHNSIGIGGAQAREEALIFLASWQGFAGRNSDLFSLVGSIKDLDRAKAERKIGMIMGLQNAEQFAAPEDVLLFYRLGLRCAQLTYNTQNLIGSGSTDRVDGGVSDFGEGIITAMNSAGMLVDVSHSGDRTTLDAIKLSKQPIAITHSNCRALCNHPRAKTDEAILALGKTDGVMGISGVRMFVKATDPTTLSDMVDHIDHVVKLIGIDHVGIGSDADLNGYDDMPPDQYAALKASYKASYAFRDKIDIEGFDHPMKMFDLTEELIRRGWSDANIALLLGGNFHRLLGAVWK
ncbi:MAG: membrane dipeptidase [Pseudomonadota bacterium]|uniref:dipeptidase n=1 Tax=Sphingomonas sp. ERG5 TaxID=1381597 RepID=UPI00054C1F9C|nr:membrane dipeptidase [Sphingomonas sp. ERG5]